MAAVALCVHTGDLRRIAMTMSRQTLAVAALVAAAASPASAQQAPTAPKSAAPSALAPLTEKNVSMRMALAIIEGVLEQCAKDGHKVSVVIVGNDGAVRASLRGDGTAPHTMEFARKKAYTARTRNMTSLEFMKLTDNPASAYLKQIPDVVAVGGGVPIRAGNVPIGAVGVSGAPGGEKDEVCANAGIEKVAEQLK
jgi:uncharacterized protein GlcG (DUF336 family)